MNHNATSLIVAIASDDHQHLPKTHFGQAPRFELYSLSADTATWLRTVDNPSGPAHQHGHQADDSAHAHHGAGSGRLLAEHDVQVMVSRAFGAHIKRMRQRFLPVIVRPDTVDDALAQLQSHWDRVRQHWAQGADRKHLVLR